MQLFQSAALKLTLWYLLIIMLISITFSVIIYDISSSELGRGLPPGSLNGRQFVLDPDAFEAFRQQRIAESSERLIRNLFVFNVITLAFGGGASYFLARRTLSPIQSAMDEQGRFVGDASHELRTPLTVIRSEIEVALRNKNLTASQMRKLLKSNLEEVDKLHSLSDRLLQLATGDTHIAMTTVSIDDIATEAINRVIPLAQAKEIAIENTVGKSTIHANAECMTDMLVVLLDNAIKYSPKKTQIIISVEQQGKFVQLSVKDQGQGIDSSDLQHIFERFYRADLSRNKDQVDGHGLGLAIAQRIAELHKTKITAMSELKKGTTFSVRLPMASPPSLTSRQA